MNRTHTSDLTAADRPLDRARPAVVVPDALRRELRLAGPAISSVADGDTARSTVVGRHLELILRMLHDHHRHEDDLVWPPLRERCAPGEMPLIEVMERQHERIHDVMERVGELRRAWEHVADGATRDDLADAAHELRSLVQDHLDLEEREVLWRAEQHLTDAEWREIGATAAAAHKGRERALVFGILQYEGDPEVVASMLAEAPAPARVLVPHLARRAYRRHATVIHGTPSP